MNLHLLHFALPVVHAARTKVSTTKGIIWAERIFLALIVPIFSAIWLVPTLKTEVENLKDAKESDVKIYAQSLSSLSSNINTLTTNISALSTKVEILQSNNEYIREVANTKVKSIEGRMSALEFEIIRIRDRTEREYKSNDHGSDK